MSVFDSVLVRAKKEDDPHLTNEFLRFANERLNIRTRSLDDLLPLLFKDPPSLQFVKKQRVSTLLTLSLLVTLQPHFFPQGYARGDLQQLQSLLQSMADADEVEEIMEPKQLCSQQLTGFLKKLNNSSDDQHLRRKDKVDEYEQKIRKLQSELDELKKQGSSDIVLNEQGNISSFSITDIDVEDVKVENPVGYPRISIISNIVLTIVVIGLLLYNFT